MRLTRRAAVASMTSAAAMAGRAWALAPANSLGAIRAVTITSGDLAAAESAWTRFMGYRVVEKGLIPAAAAASWGAPALAGKAFVSLGPASGEPTLLRFVDQPTPAGYSPVGTLGWSTTEITVKNSDRLYERLKDSPFKILHPPHQIATYPYLKAMQAEGPSGERLNLTWIHPSKPDLALALSFVGRCYIAVQGSPDLPGTLRFFAEVFGSSVSRTHKVPEAAATIELAVVDLADGCKIEADQYPASAPPRLRPDGGLPFGLAMVSFECKIFSRLAPRFTAPASRLGLAPFARARSAVMTGPAGELIELVEV